MNKKTAPPSSADAAAQQASKSESMAAPFEDSEVRPPPRNDKAWITSFADLVSLMLVFFVLLFSMSEVKREQWNAVVEALAARLNPTRVILEANPGAERTVERVDLRPTLDLDYLSELVIDRLEHPSALPGVRLTRLQDRLVLSLPTDGMFDPGGATLTAESEAGLRLLATFLVNIGNRIDVRGHADPRPFRGQGAFQDNWDLSLARADSVARALADAGYGRSIAVIGLGSSRFNDLSRNLPEERRFVLARRVDIVIRNAAGAGGLGDG